MIVVNMSLWLGDEAILWLRRLLRPCGARNDVTRGDCFAPAGLAMTPSLLSFRGSCVTATEESLR
jgi:hypothetical protein